MAVQACLSPPLFQRRVLFGHFLGVVLVFLFGLGPFLFWVCWFVLVGVFCTCASLVLTVNSHLERES